MRVYETCQACGEVSRSEAPSWRESDSYETTIKECGFCIEDRERVEAAAEAVRVG
jgi:hypothetical protein